MLLSDEELLLQLLLVTWPRSSLLETGPLWVIRRKHHCFDCAGGDCCVAGSLQHPAVCLVNSTLVALLTAAAVNISDILLQASNGSDS